MSAFLDLSWRAVLRRVVLQRELEQEAAIVATSPAQLQSRCRCGRRVNNETGERVCSLCRKPERERRRREAALFDEVRA